MSLTNKLSTALLSDVGCVRTNNEDAVGLDAGHGLLVLADGMGGHNAGEVASRIAVETVIKVVQEEAFQMHRKSSRRRSLPGAPDILRQAVISAHEAIYQAAHDHPEHAGMGTTLVVALLQDDRVHVAHVGDSRLYRSRLGHLQPLTRDHSALEDIVVLGELSRREAKQSVRRNLITRALGLDADIAMTVAEHPLSVGDLLLLCSDGLSDVVTEERIGLSLREHGDDLGAAATDLISLARTAGAPDNVSVVLARIDPPAEQRKTVWQRLLEWF